MGSLTIALSPAMSGRVFAATAATKSAGSGRGSGEKGFLDWILGGMQKEDQLVETDPILKKVEEKNGGTTSRKSSSSGSGSGNGNSVAVPQKKKSGGPFGGLFAKK